MKTELVLKVSVNELNDKKARDIMAIKIDEVTEIADYFVIATATSSTHVRSLSDYVEERLTAEGIEPNHKETKANDWMLLDYGDVVIHIFDQKAREFYSLERMWAGGTVVDLADILDNPTEVE